MQKSLAEIINKTHERKQTLHKEFLKDLSIRFRDKLFKELSLQPIKFLDTFVEPQSKGIEKAIPDIIFLYLDPRRRYSLLLVEAKASTSRTTFQSLDREFPYLRCYINEKGEMDKDLYSLLEEKIPWEVLKICQVDIAAVYRTKMGGFKIYKYEKLR